MLPHLNHIHNLSNLQQNSGPVKLVSANSIEKSNIIATMLGHKLAVFLVVLQHPDQLYQECLKINPCLVLLGCFY